MENEKIDLAWRLVNETGANVFITGKAGTGKTTFLKRLKEESTKNIVVLAPTGIAALNAGGMTIHSFFQLSFSPYIPGVGQSEGNSRFSKYSKQKIKMLRSIDTIVIDEISMVRADILDAIDSKLRRYRNASLPMGGVQLVMIGDIQQLPPVVREDEWRMLSEHYRTPYFFDSHLLRDKPFETIELTKVYRQKDRDFIDILNAIRENKVDSSILGKLNDRHIPGFDPSDDERYIRLMTHNHQAQRVNEQHMDGLKTKKHLFTAQIEGEFPEIIYPAEKELILKEGAQVMFLKNDSQGGHRYYNGTIGRIKSISDSGKIIVMLNDDTPPIEVEKETWENMAYILDEKTKRMKEKVVGRFTQIPLRAAWAITIHKSQGLTFDKAIINASAAFAHGQTYVALSRCRSLTGLVLENPLPHSAIISDRTVSEFERDCNAREADTRKVDALQTEFRIRVDLEIADLTGLRNALDSLHRVLQVSHASAYPKQTANFGEMLATRFKDIYEVSLRFQQQLRRMSSQGATQMEIHGRLRAAADYFLNQLDPIVDMLRSLPQEIDSEEARRNFAEAMALVEFEETLKDALFKETLKKKLSPADFMKIKRELSIADPQWVKVDTKPKASTGGADVENPEMFDLLVQWRREKAKEDGVPVYQILGNRSLVFLANELPQTEEDLLAIPGIGRRKAADYGADLLALLCRHIIHLILPILLFASCSKQKAPDHSDLYEEIRQVNRMEFASLAVTKTVKTERSDWYKIGKRIAVYSYDTYLKAFIDLNLMAPDDMEFDEENKTVHVTLPPVQIEIAGRDMDMKNEYENVGMFRTEISSQERAKMKEKANDELKKELAGNPEYKQRLEEAARRKARSYFESLLRNAGYTAYVRFSDDSNPTGDFNIKNYDKNH